MAFQNADDAANTDTNWQFDSNGNLVNYGSPLESEPPASYALSPSVFNMLANDFDQYEFAFEVGPEDFPMQSIPQSFQQYIQSPMSPIPLSPRIGTGYVESMVEESEPTSVTAPPAQPSRVAANRQSITATLAATNENRIGKKRHPRKAGGYHCADSGCRRPFDTQGAATKHYQRAHILEADRPFQCPHCDRRFLWGKDVKRHMGQMHAALQTAVALRAPNLRRPSLNFETLFGGMGGPLFAALRAAVQMKRVAIRIRARRRSESELGGPRYIMVTRNHLDFRAIPISGCKTATALRSTIHNNLDVPPPDDFALAPYVLGTGYIANCLNPIQLFNTVTNAPAGRGPLYFFLRSATL